MSERVPALDGIRAVAVLAVLLFHAESLSPGTQRFQGGFLGVSVFFTLSGFLIGGQLLREHEDHMGVRARAFVTRRIARLAPVAFCVIALVVAISPTRLATWNAFGPSDALSAIWQFTNWHLAWLPDTAGFRLVHPLTHFWSLSVEVQLYALVLLAAIAGGAAPLRPRLQRLAIVGWTASLVMALVLHSTVRREEFGTDVRLAEFAAGVLLAVWLPRWRARGLAASGVAAVGIFCACVVFVGREEFWLSNGGYALLSLAWCAWIAAVHRAGLLQRVFSHPMLVAVGEISYSLYAVHWPVVLALPDSRIHFGGWSAVAVRCVVSLLAAVVLHRLVERPLRQRLTSLSAARTVGLWLAAAAATSALSLALLSG